MGKQVLRVAQDDKVGVNLSSAVHLKISACHLHVYKTLLLVILSAAKDLLFCCVLIKADANDVFSIEPLLA